MLLISKIIKHIINATLSHTQIDISLKQDNIGYTNIVTEEHWIYGNIMKVVKCHQEKSLSTLVIGSGKNSSIQYFYALAQGN